jgi:hypothetical protein
MCWECVVEQGGADVAWTANMDLAAAAIESLYVLRSTGGPLHVITDDFNVGDATLDFCEGELDRDPEVADLCRLILAELRPMSEAQRARACWGDDVPVVNA